MYINIKISKICKKKRIELNDVISYIAESKLLWHMCYSFRVLHIKIRQNSFKVSYFFLNVGVEIASQITFCFSYK
jgi:hypothetical protein